MASIWEIVIKAQLGRISLRLPMPVIVAERRSNGLQLLPVSLPHVLAVQELPPIHKGPFDRILIAQALVVGADMVSADHIFTAYPINCLW